MNEVDFASGLVDEVRKWPAEWQAQVLFWPKEDYLSVAAFVVYQGETGVLCLDFDLAEFDKENDIENGRHLAKGLREIIESV